MVRFSFDDSGGGSIIRVGGLRRQSTKTLNEEDSLCPIHLRTHSTAPLSVNLKNSRRLDASQLLDFSLKTSIGSY